MREPLMETPENRRLNSLSARTKAGRTAIADALCKAAELHGATVDRREGGDYPGPRRICLTFTLDGAEAHISLDGESRLQSVALISWCARGGAGRCFSHTFEMCAGAFRGGGMPHHKATSCSETVADLVNDLDGGLMSIAHGSAFQHFVHPWAADTAWVANGSPTDRPKSEWLEEYRRTGVAPSVSPAIQAARDAAIAVDGHSGPFGMSDAARQAAERAYQAAIG